MLRYALTVCLFLAACDLPLLRAPASDTLSLCIAHSPRAMKSMAQSMARDGFAPPVEDDQFSRPEVLAQIRTQCTCAQRILTPEDFGFLVDIMQARGDLADQNLPEDVIAYRMRAHLEQVSNGDASTGMARYERIERLITEHCSPSALQTP